MAPAREGAFSFAFEMAVGVKHGNDELRRRLDEAIARRQPDIEALLRRYRVPRVP